MEMVMKSMLKGLQLGCSIILAGGWISQVQAEEFSGYDCLIEPHSVIEVSTMEDGVMAEILVTRGDVIKKGQVLARLDSSVEEVAVNIARARAKMKSKIDSKRAGVKYLKAQQARIDELYEKEAIPIHEKQKASTDVILASAELREARENYELAQLEKQRAEKIMERRTIRSLIDGVVVDVLVDAGESVEDRPVMIIAEVDPLNVEVILPEKMYGMVKVGTRAEVEPLIQGGEKIITSVVVVDKVIDAASNTFGVRLELENQDHAIPGGIRCDINFLLDEDDTSGSE
jgi:RND family efflux transporter MFP subunit